MYVQFNAKLFSKKRQIREKNVDAVEEWLVGRVQYIDSDLGLMLSTQAPRVRDLYDDDFESEEEYAVDMEFEPDVYQDIPTFRESQQQQPI